MGCVVCVVWSSILLGVVFVRYCWEKKKRRPGGISMIYIHVYRVAIHTKYVLGILTTTSRMGVANPRAQGTM